MTDSHHQHTRDYVDGIECESQSQSRAEPEPVPEQVARESCDDELYQDNASENNNFFDVVTKVGRVHCIVMSPGADGTTVLLHSTKHRQRGDWVGVLCDEDASLGQRSCMKIDFLLSVRVQCPHDCMLPRQSRWYRWIDHS